jgi:LPXTG-site transpeptidase (sortase) family protein
VLTRPDEHVEHGGHRLRWSAVLGTCALALVSACSGSGPVGTDPPARADRPLLAPFVVEPAVVLHAVEERRRAPARQPAAGRPSRLIVPTLEVNVPVIGIDVATGVLTPPADPQLLGWWRGGAVPGAARGGALITGHTVHSGGGAFDELETLRAGDRVVVRTAKGRIRYAVTGVTVYRKATLAKDAGRVFRQTGPGRLVLITCEDWNGSGYDSNAVVFAEPL